MLARHDEGTDNREDPLIDHNSCFSDLSDSLNPSNSLNNSIKSNKLQLVYYVNVETRHKITFINK